MKEKANNWWKSKGEWRDETRGRLEKWWAEQEEMIMSDLHREAASKEAKEGVEKAEEAKLEETVARSNRLE